MEYTKKTTGPGAYTLTSTDGRVSIRRAVHERKRYSQARGCWYAKEVWFTASVDGVEILDSQELKDAKTRAEKASK